MAHAQPLALDHVLAGGGDVEQQIDQMILQQIHLVDVQKAAIGAGQQAGLERLDASRQRPLEIERADHAVLGGAERQVDHRHRHQLGLQRPMRLRARGNRRTVAPLAAGSQP